MKKNKCSLVTPIKDWEGYKNNFSDLLALSETPKRKRRKRRSTNLLKTDNSELKASQDGSINNWSSSEEENARKVKLQFDLEDLNDNVSSSPILHSSTTKRTNITGRSGSLVKRTPSGSPILSQTPYRFSTARKRKRIKSLLAISPITPGLNRSSFAEKSYFSLHANNETSFEPSGLDNTPLAIPLIESDEEIVNEFGSTSGDDKSLLDLTQQEIDVVTTQTEQEQQLSQNNQNISLTLFSTQDDEIPNYQNKSDPQESLTDLEPKVKGSSWIEGVIEKIDEDCMNTTAPEYSVSASLYDSAKKQKFIKNGFAEQLQRVNRQQKTHYVLFKHQSKSNIQQNEKDIQYSLTLKAISHHKEGILHVLECKVLDRGNQVKENDQFYTLILQHEVIVENNINLTTTFTIFPPWKCMNLENHNFPVLLCVNHIQVLTHKQTDENANINPTTLANKEAALSCDNYCESLLRAVEKQNIENSISLAATIQRIYQRQQPFNNSTPLKWRFLCEDAFGVFFEVELDAVLSVQEKWLHLITHGEGQRVIFENLYLSGRTTRPQCPSLFSLINSVWNSDGFGLQQVQNSESQSQKINSQSDSWSLCGSQKSPNIKPPSFCYKLLARNSSSKLIFSTTSNQDKNTFYSDLNRPTLEGCTNTDVLYKQPNLIQYSNIKQEKLDSIYRCSILCKVVYIHESTKYNNIKLIDYNTYDYLFVVDKNDPTNKDIITITMLNGISEKLKNQNVVLLKDVAINGDGKLSMDQYSTSLLLFKLQFQQSQDLPTLDTLSDNIFTTIKKEKIDMLVNVKLPRLENISISTQPYTFVTVEGLICGVTTYSSYDRQSPDQEMTTISKTQLWFNNKNSSQDQLEIVVICNNTFKVKIKLLQETAWKLVCNLPFVQKLHCGSLNNRNVGPLNCFVYMTENSNFETVISAVEVHI